MLQTVDYWVFIITHDNRHYRWLLIHYQALLKTLNIMLYYVVRNTLSNNLKEASWPVPESPTMI
jgi:hypothetical protein